MRAGVPITHRDQLPRSSRYELLVKIASGGMATVYVGRLSTAAGFTRLVAIKRAHAHLLEDPAFGKMLVAEAKLASRIHHPNVVAVQNVEEVDGELLLVMDYVEGASLADLVAVEDPPLPARASVRIILDACAGLHAAHGLEGDRGEPLGIVHRDVSPHNILVGVDGIARLADFGIAKSSEKTASASRTTTGALKGKVSYMAPEYVESGGLDARGDVFALGVVAWEALTRRRLFRGLNEVESLRLVLACDVPRPSLVAPWVGRALDAVLAKALARDPSARFSTAAEFGDALEAAARGEELLASHTQVGAFVKVAAGDALAQRRVLVRGRHDPSPAPPLPLEAAAEFRPRDSMTASLQAEGPFTERDPPARGPTPLVPSSHDDPGDVQVRSVGASTMVAEGARSRWRWGAVLAVIAVGGGASAAIAVPALRPAARAPAVAEPTASASSSQGSGETPPSALASPPGASAARPEADPRAAPSAGSAGERSPSADSRAGRGLSAVTSAGRARAPAAGVPIPARTMAPDGTRPPGHPEPTPTETSADRAPPNPYKR